MAATSVRDILLLNLISAGCPSMREKEEKRDDGIRKVAVFE